MSEDLLIIRNNILIFLGCSLFITAMMGLMLIDVVWLHNAVHELSLTEIAQEVMLAAIAALLFLRAYRAPEQRSALVLVAGFFSCMLIREMDFLFDVIAHGSWLWFALAAALGCVAVALSKPRSILSGLAGFLRHPAWNMMCAGMLTVLVFSRFFGMHELWQSLMLDGYNRTVKNMAEEGSELLGYSMCLFATFSYLWQRPRHAEKQDNVPESTTGLTRTTAAQ